MHLRSPFPKTLTAVEPADARGSGGSRRRWARPGSGNPLSRREGTLSQRLLRFAWPPPPWRSLLAVAVLLTVVGGAGLTVGAHRGSAMPTALIALEAALAFGFLPAGLLAVRRRPRELAPMLIATVGLLAVFALAAAAWSGVFVGAWIAHWAWWPPVGLLPVLLLCYPCAPDSDRARGWLDVAVFAAVAGTACLMDAVAVSPNAVLIGQRREIGVAATILTVGWLVAALVVAGTLLGAVIRLLVRARRLDRRARRAAVCLMPAAAMVPVAALLTWQGLPMGYLLPVPVLGVGLAAGLLPDAEGRGDRWWQLGLTAAFAAALAYTLFSVGAVWLPRLAAVSPWVVPALGTTLAVGLAAATARWWWRAIDSVTGRMRYGGDREAYDVLRDRAVRVSTVTTVGDITGALTAALGVPGSRIRADLGAAAITVAESGHCTEPMTRFPILGGDGRPLGALEVAPRAAGEGFDEQDLGTVRRAVRRAAAAIEAEMFLWSAHQGAVAAVTRREEDRRRLRTELEDTLLPTLSGCRGELEAARVRMPSARTAALLDPVIGELTEASAAVRRLMDRLRPEVLELGLATAIAQVARRRLPDVAVRVEFGSQASADADTDGSGSVGTRLAPAVEVAAYRIVVEALTGAALRGGVQTASVRMRVSPRQLDLVVLDDGRLAAGRGALDGGDTLAMRTAAEELGGRLTVISSVAGTRVSAVLPLPPQTEPASDDPPASEDPPARPSLQVQTRPVALPDPGRSLPDRVAVGS